jgi:hypothetical protein
MEWRKGELISCTISSRDNVSKYRYKWWAASKVQWAIQSTMEKVSAPKLFLARMFSVIPWAQSVFPSAWAPNPGVREPILVAILFNPQRKNRALMQKVNVSQGKTKMDKTVRRRELPCVHHSRSLYRERVGCGAASISMEKKRRSKEDANKRKWRKSDTCTSRRSLKLL